MKKGMKPKITAIIAKEWFDKVNGNSYHNVSVYAGGNLIFKSGFTYGYGDHYLQTAFEGLVKLGYYTDTRRENGSWEDYGKFTDDLHSILHEKHSVRTMRECKA